MWHKRQRDNAAWAWSVTNDRRQSKSGRGIFGFDEGHRDRAIHRCAESAAGDPADVALFAIEQGLALADRRAAIGDQSDSTTRGSLLDLLQDDCRTGEPTDACTAVPAHFLNRPFKRGFDR